MSASQPAQVPRRRWRRRLTIALACVLALLLALAWLLQPQRIGPYALRRLGDSLDLTITARHIDYRLRGTPQLTLDGIDVRQPGASTALLTARHALLSLPWSTLRSFGKDRTLERIHLDQPRLDLSALQHWLASRPPSPPPRLPPLTHGVQVTDGRLDGGGWRIEAIAIDLPALLPEREAQAQVRGRYVDASTKAEADLRLTLAGPQRAVDGKPSRLSASGPLTISAADWRIDSQAVIAGELKATDDGLLLRSARFGLSARFGDGKLVQPFRIGLFGALAFGGDDLRYAPMQLVLRGDSAIPALDARGTLTLDDRLGLKLAGTLADWPAGWPALPPPLSDVQQPLAVTLAYLGAANLDDATALSLQRGDTRFDARFRLPVVQQWLQAGANGSPLPPLVGTLTTPRLVISGATLEGVEIELDDGSQAH